MNSKTSGEILAVVSMHREKVGGGAPIFFVDNEEALEKTALYLSRVLMGAVHEITNGTLIVIRH